MKYDNFVIAFVYKSVRLFHANGPKWDLPRKINVVFTNKKSAEKYYNILGEMFDKIYAAEDRGNITHGFNL